VDFWWMNNIVNNSNS